MQDRTDHVLAAIDGALDDYAMSDDATRWSPERPKRVLPPDLSGMTLSAEQIEALSYGFQLAGAIMSQLRAACQDALTAMVQSPHWQAFRAFAESPEGRAFVEAARRGEFQRETRVSCSCLCTGRHPGRNVCTGEAGDRALRYRTERLGVVDVAMCDPCVDVQP